MFTQVVIGATLIFQVMALAASIRLLAISTRRARYLPLIVALLLLGRSVVMMWATATGAVHAASLAMVLSEGLLFVVSAATALLLYILPARLKMHRDEFTEIQQSRRELQQRVAEQATSLQHSVSQLDVESARHKAAAAALQTVEKVYSRTLDAQPDRICRYRTDGTMTFANQQYCAALGLPRDSVVGQNVFDVVPAVFHSAIRDAVKRLSQAVPVLSSEQFVVRVEGEHWELWTRHAIFDTAGNLVEIQAVGRDITPQRLAERALSESEHRLRRMVEHMPVLIAALDANGTIVYWGRECECLTGYSAEEMMGNPQAFDVLYPDDAYHQEVDRRVAALGGDFRDEETTLTCKDGSTRIISWASVSEVQPVSGWHKWLVGIDVTARKQAEAALQRAHDSLETQVAERTAELQAAQHVLEREIAERHRAEIAVRQSQTQLRATLDGIDDIVYVIDADLRITVCNAALLRFARETGLSADPLGMTPFDLFPFLSDQMRGEYFRVFETGETRSSEDVFTLGAVQWVNEIRKIPIRDAAGQVTHVLTVIHDITARTRSAAQLAASEDMTRRLIEQSPHGITLVNAEGIIVEWNAAFVQLTGIPHAEAVGRYMWEMEQRTVPAEMQGEGWLARQRQNALDFLQGKAGPVASLNYNIRTQAGAHRTVRANMFLLQTAQGAMAASIVEDVTERQASTQALGASEQRLHTLIDTMPDIIIVKDGAGRWLLANEATLQLFGLGGVQYQGRTNSELADQSPFYRVALLACDDTDTAAWQAGTLTTAEETFPQRDGPPRVFDVIHIPVFDTTGVRLELMVVGREITARQRAERHAFQVAVERERSTILADFIRDTSHEFANPLSVIKTNVYIAQQTDDPERVAVMLDGIRGQTLHIEKLVEGLLAMSRLDQGVQLAQTPVRIGDLLHGVMDMVRKAAAQREHTLVLELVEDLPLINADAHWLHRALAELLYNAIQHTPEGGTITVTAARTDGQIVVSVHDTGIGISADHVPHIFERFYRVDKARAARGAGLGLAIAQQVAERHGGTITVESTPHAGSNFRLHLPIPPA